MEAIQLEKVGGLRMQLSFSYTLYAWHDLEGNLYTICRYPLQLSFSYALKDLERNLYTLFLYKTKDQFMPLHFVLSLDYQINLLEPHDYLSQMHTYRLLSCLFFIYIEPRDSLVLYLVISESSQIFTISLLSITKLIITQQSKLLRH